MAIFLLCITLMIVMHINGEPLAGTSDFLASLREAERITQSILDEIYTRWEIDAYPNFLKSVAMTHASWEIMKLKYKTKIVKNGMNVATEDDKSFVISFLGSSVTAGHDSPFNHSFPIQTGNLMRKAFEPLKIKLETRNCAMGNNPCQPYDICPKTYAGNDADLIHWEQSFNCFPHDNRHAVNFEQFIRQSLSMRKQPIVVFTESASPNWNEKECDKPENQHPITLKPNDQDLLSLYKKGDYKSIVTDMNQGLFSHEWGNLKLMFNKYMRFSGIQIWSHRHYEEYKCRGPYIRKWQCCSASWHPSLLGHELRAAHHAFFWLLAYKVAVRELIEKTNEGMSLSLQYTKLEELLRKEFKLEYQEEVRKPMYESYYTDDMQCVTAFEPINDKKMDLAKYIVPSGDDKPVFNRNIFEEITNKGIINTAKSRGYLDFKNMYWGNKDNSPLSLKIKVTTSNTFFLCEPPGNWGKLPAGFKTFWEAETKIYLTKEAGVNAADFKFDPDKAESLTYTNRRPEDSQTVCVDFAPYKLPIGEHILTIVPTTDSKIMISTIILPK